MLNIQIQSCALVILLMISYFYFRLPKVQVRSKWTFLAMLLACLVCTVFDIISVILIYYSESLPSALVKAGGKVYILFLLITVYMGFMYICSDFCKTEKKFQLATIISSAIFLPILCLMLALPISYECEKDGAVIYTYGPSTTVAYVGFGIMLAAMIVLLILGRLKMNRRRNLSVFLWLLIWVICAIVQFLVPTLLIVSFAASIGILIIFIMIENPGQSLDKESPFFNNIAMAQYVDERYTLGKRFSLIVTHFSHREIPLYMSLPHKYIFVGDKRIYILTNTAEETNAGLERLIEKTENHKIYVLEDCTLVSSSEELLTVLKQAERIYSVTEARVCHIDETLIKRIEDINKTKRLIERTIEEHSVEVFYQPIYSIKENKFVSAEALARIRDNDGNIVPPYKFIPIAESNGSIVSLGKQIFEKVCRLFSEKEGQLTGLKYIEINLSVVQGEDENLADDVINMLTQYRIAPERINLEITESASAHGREQLLENMKKLINRGIEFSLDDFGTGQSNLDYMAIMPVRIVKFDRNMTQSYFQSDKTRFIMNAAIHMIHDMGMSVVVEGIETEEQYLTMKSLKVEYIQGFYFSKPIPESEFITFLQTRNL